MIVSNTSTTAWPGWAFIGTVWPGGHADPCTESFLPGRFAKRIFHISTSSPGAKTDRDARRLPRAAAQVTENAVVVGVCASGHRVPPPLLLPQLPRTTIPRVLRRVDRIILRVPNLPAAVRFYRDVMGLRPVREDARIASLRFPDDRAELVLHTDADLPAEAVYYAVDDVRQLFARREQLKLQFIHPPAVTARGYRAAVRDPFGNVLLIVDQTLCQDTGVTEDAKAPSALFPGIEEPQRVDERVLVDAYRRIGRTADDLPYTPDFEKLYFECRSAAGCEGLTRGELWRQLLNMRKGGRLPRLGEARSRAPAVSEQDRQRLRQMLGNDIGKRDRLPYTDRFAQLVDEFNRTQRRPLSPHLVWRLVATLAK